MPQVVRLASGEAAPAAPPAPGGFVKTGTAEEVLRSLRLLTALPGPAITMIAGAPGVGKTRALRAFAEEEPGALIHTAAAGEGRPWNLACGLMARINDRPNGRDLTASRRSLAEALGPRTVLIVDEAQALEMRRGKEAINRDALEWLRALAEEGGFALALCGDLALASAVRAVPQLQSRLRRPVVIRAVAKEDAGALAAAAAVTDRKALALLEAVAMQRGGLRNVENVLRLARIYAGGGRPEPEHMATAARAGS
jgi:DNA transposition AAA+ family ATPase